MFLKSFLHPKKKYRFKDITYDNDIYFQSISALVEKDLDYYLKNLEIIVKEDGNQLVDLNYDYYNKNENIANTNIQIYFVSVV